LGISQPPIIARRSSLGARLYRQALRLYVWLIGRRRYDRLVLERVHGRPIMVIPQVFNPKLLRSGALLAGLLDPRWVPRGAAVLDMGTGSGIGAVFAAQWAGRVVAVDINPEAVRCARINALLNHVDERVDVRQGDLFAPLAGERFDLVLFNPPFFRGQPRDLLDHAWRSVDTVERFAAGLSDHLRPGGRALVLLSTDGETPAFLEAFQAHGLSVRVVAQHDLWNEVCTIYCLTVR
jgi:release factor glutamine methyltransferase